MSRIGQKFIQIPSNVKISISENILTAEGNLGILSIPFFKVVQISVIKNRLIITTNENIKKIKAYHGLIRSLIKNIIVGVSEGFIKILIAEGVGYKFQINNNQLILNMGYTHPIFFNIPNDIKLFVDNLTKLTIKGINKENVGLFADKIRAVRPPEPYKGKGIKYENEQIKRKVGKK